MDNGSEDEVKRALGIESWRNLSKEGVMRLVAMMPEMSTEVALPEGARCLHSGTRQGSES